MMQRPTPALGDEPTPLSLSRRTLVGTVFAATLIAAADEPLTRRGTPQLTIGPFYPLHRPSEEDPDLTKMTGRAELAFGTLIEIFGQIGDETGRPISGAMIDTWQTNGYGAYHHPSDESGQPKDPGFQGGAIFSADAEGRFRIRTVMPLPYASRQRHVHFDIKGRNRRLITQMFFPGEPNTKDPLFNSLRNADLERSVTAVEHAPIDGWKRYEWNVRLAGE
jgi:protocatechuate 3,4-dioxygenase, beta subunit